MQRVKVYHSLPKDLHEIQPKVSDIYSLSLGPGKKRSATRKPDYYTGPPWRLMWDDTILFFKHFFYLKNIVMPLWQDPRDGQPSYPSGDLDELYPSSANMKAIVLHSFLIVIQSIFLISLLFAAAFPFPLLAAYVGIFVTVNNLTCRMLNGSVPVGGLESTHFPECDEWNQDPDERWVFLNGVAVGKHWLQSNIDRISLTFHRKVLGVHNKTSGIIFDVIQCILERCLYFGTSDTRGCFAIISQLLRDTDKKVILILHSQGGLEGSIILDWLMNQHSQETMRRLEIYTFGNAANHFNNPRVRRHDEKSPGGEDKRAVGHIEHFANSEDFVARWGVTHFKKETAAQKSLSNVDKIGGQDHAAVCARETAEANALYQLRHMHDDRVVQAWNSYHGNLLERRGSGHQLNQHYLDNMFPLDETRRRAAVGLDGAPLPGTFMDLEVDVINDPRKMDRLRGRAWEHEEHEEHDHEISLTGVICKKKVYQLSRLWSYTNGRCPET